MIIEDIKNQKIKKFLEENKGENPNEIILNERPFEVYSVIENDDIHNVIMNPYAGNTECIYINTHIKTITKKKEKDIEQLLKDFELDLISMGIIYTFLYKNHNGFDCLSFRLRVSDFKEKTIQRFVSRIKRFEKDVRKKKNVSTKKI